VVQQVDRGSIVLKLDTAEAIIPAREVMHRDRFRQREMVRGLVIKVDKEARGPQVILSRTHPDFLTRLFQEEVPEIGEHVVEVKAVAREAGYRSKIAVLSHDTRIDAVGACVGIKGSRVQSIVKELGGERIDIVPWTGDPVVFVTRSLSPAKVLNAKVDEVNHQVTVIVPDDQLSLAIGKQGQNVRLAAKLTSWKIELHSQSEYEASTAAAGADVELDQLEGILEPAVGVLQAAGVTHATQIEKLGLEDLLQVEGLSESSAEKIYGVALAALATARAEAAAQATKEAEGTTWADALETGPAEEEGSTEGAAEAPDLLPEAVEAGEVEEEPAEEEQAAPAEDGSGTMAEGEEEPAGDEEEASGAGSTAEAEPGGDVAAGEEAEQDATRNEEQPNPSGS
jgi:N utilization substance protein A